MTCGDIMSLSIEKLEDRLSSFEPFTRRRALGELVRRVGKGDIHLPSIRNEANLHYHTFFSFNANGWSPSRTAWEARKHGLAVAGIVDFDVLDGMEEFLSAGEAIGLRSTAALETRVLISEYSDHVINSPHEPGVAYFMAGGCFQQPAKNSIAEHILQSMRDLARRRNIQVMERVDAYLDTVQIDYEVDVLPLTPSGNATERHLLAAYEAKSWEVYNDQSAMAEFWANALQTSRTEAADLLADTPRFHEKMRSKLMKYGGVGYVPPGRGTFPSIETAIEMVDGMHSLPTATWLDGTNSGEADMPSMLQLLADKGVVAVNIIPDRNWNVKDPDEKRTKMANLAKAVEAARQIRFPLCVGTEMNKDGQPFVDNFSAVELQPYIDDFVDGAYFFWGHTFLAQDAGIGYASEWSKAHFEKDRGKKNAFYAKVGRLAEPADAKSKISGMDLKAEPPNSVIKALQ